MAHARADNDHNHARILYSFENEVIRILKGRKRLFTEQLIRRAFIYTNQVRFDFIIFRSWHLAEHNDNTTVDAVFDVD